MSAPHRIVRAWLESPSSGLIELDRDWAGRANPLFSLGKPGPKLLGLAPAAGLATGRSTGYFVDATRGEIAFVLPLDHGSQVDPGRDTVFVAGDFNGWQAAVGKPEWQLAAAELDGGR